MFDLEDIQDKSLRWINMQIDELSDKQADNGYIDESLNREVKMLEEERYRRLYEPKDKKKKKDDLFKLVHEENKCKIILKKINSIIKDEKEIFTDPVINMKNNEIFLAIIDELDMFLGKFNFNKKLNNIIDEDNTETFLDEIKNMICDRIYLYENFSDEIKNNMSSVDLMIICDELENLYSAIDKIKF